MKRGGRLARRTPLRSFTPLRRKSELRSSRKAPGSGGEGSAASAVQPESRSDAPRVARGLRATFHRVAADLRATVRERSGGVCEVHLAGCWGRANQLQHRITQKAGGRHGKAVARSDRPSNVLDSCGFCHSVITDSPGTSKQFGWSLEEWQEPSREPVLYRGDLVYLDDEGQVHSFEKAGA